MDDPAYCPCCGMNLRDLLTQKHMKEGLTDCEARILIDELRKQVGVCQASIKRITKERDETQRILASLASSGAALP